MNTYPRLMNTAEAAEYLGMSAYTLREKVREKKIRAFKSGRGYKFFKVFLDEWIKEQEV